MARTEAEEGPCLQLRRPAGEDVDGEGAPAEVAEPNDGTQPTRAGLPPGHLEGRPRCAVTGDLTRRNPLVVTGRLPDLLRPPVAELLRDVRLQVHRADQTDDEPATGRTSVYGGVEMTLRTVA